MDEIKVVMQYIATHYFGESTPTSSTYYIRKIYDEMKIKVSNQALIIASIIVFHNPYEIIDNDIIFPYDLTTNQSIKKKYQHLSYTRRLQFVKINQTNCHLIKNRYFTYDAIMEYKETCYLLHRRGNCEIIGFVCLKSNINYSPQFLEIFIKNKHYGKEVVQELERNMIGKTMYVTTIKQSLYFWLTLGYLPYKLNQVAKRIF